MNFKRCRIIPPIRVRGYEINSKTQVLCKYVVIDLILRFRFQIILLLQRGIATFQAIFPLITIKESQRLCALPQKNLMIIPSALPNLTCEIMWLHHDGAPLLYSLQVRHHLTSEFSGGWIRRG